MFCHPTDAAPQFFWKLEFCCSAIMLSCPKWFSCQGREWFSVHCGHSLEYENFTLLFGGLHTSKKKNYHTCSTIIFPHSTIHYSLIILWHHCCCHCCLFNSMLWMLQCLGIAAYHWQNRGVVIGGICCQIAKMVVWSCCHVASFEKRK